MKEKTSADTRITFTKEQILGFKKFQNRTDILGIILNDGATYTIEAVDSLLENFMKGKVNE